MPTLPNKTGYSLNYEVHGNPHALPAQTMILAHGNANCLKDWEALGYLAIFKRELPNFKFILMDALGYGDSDKPLDSSQYTSERRAEDVISVMDTLGVKTAHFFGNSIGGSLGFVLADLYQERFNSFILGSAHPYGSHNPDGTERAGANLFGDMFKTILREQGIEGFVNLVETQFIQRPLHPGVKGPYMSNVPNVLILANTPKWPDRSVSLAKIQKPVLLYAGSKDPVSEDIKSFAYKIPQCTFELIAGADHCDTYWDGKRIAPIIVNFLKSNFPIYIHHQAKI